MELLDEFGVPVLEDFKTSAKRFKDQGADDAEVQQYIADFKAMKPKIKDTTQKDIDKWKTWDEFKAFVDDLKNVKTKGQEKKEKKQQGAKLVVEDKYWKVYHITTHEAAMLYGSGTKWCITQEDGSYWKQYAADSDFYFYLSKRLGPTSPYYKIALQHEYDSDTYTYWDATDKNHGASERDFWSRGKLGSIPFKLPEIPGEHMQTMKSKHADEQSLISIYLDRDVEAEHLKFMEAQLSDLIVGIIGGQHRQEIDVSTMDGGINIHLGGNMDKLKSDKNKQEEMAYGIKQIIKGFEYDITDFSWGL